MIEVVVSIFTFISMQLRRLLLPDAERGIHLFLLFVLAGLSFVFEFSGGILKNSAYSGFHGDDKAWSFTTETVFWIGLVGYVAASEFVRTVSIFIVGIMYAVLAKSFVDSILPGQIANFGSVTFSLIAVLGFYLAALRTFAK